MSFTQLSPKFRWLITGSLLLNVLLLGIMLGQMSHRFPPRPDLADIPQQRIEQFHEAMNAARAEGKEDKETIHRLRREAIDILSKDPIDAAAYDATTQQIHELRGKQSIRMAQAIKSLAQTWPPEDRTALHTLLRRPNSKDVTKATPNDRPEGPPPGE